MTRLPIRVALFCAAFASAVAAAQGPEQHEGADFQRRRTEWYEGQRAYPDTAVNWDLLLSSTQRWLAMRSQSAHLFASAVSGSWTPLGPFGFHGVGYWDSGPQLDAGRVDGIALHPTNPDIMYVASPYGGIWGTTTGGASWTPLTDNMCTLQMATVKVDPVNPQLVYAAARAASGAANCGIFRSTNGGATFESFNGTGVTQSAFTNRFNEWYIDRATAGNTNTTIMLLTRPGTGIYRTSNSGNSWTVVLNFGSSHSIVELPGRPGVLFTGVWDNATQQSARNGIYRSADNGVTWTQVSSGSIDFRGAARYELAVSADRPNSVWILASSTASQFRNLARWDDDEGLMTSLGAGGVLSATGRVWFGEQGNYDLDIKVDPTNANRIYIAGVRAFRSIDGGATFTPMGTEIHCDWQTLVIDPRNPRVLWAGTDGGIYTSIDGGDTWRSRNYGLMISMWYPGISQHPTDPSIVLGGLQDNGTLMANGTTIYNSVTGGDGGFAAINYNSPNTIWTSCQWSTTSGACLFKRTYNATGTFTSFSVRSGIVASDRAAFIPPLVMDPVTPTTLYFGTMRLYRTVNDGVLWTPITPDLSNGSGTVRSIAVAPSDANTIYVGTSDGNVHVSRDGGATFVRTTGIPTRVVTDIGISRSDPGRAVATVSGSGVVHVWKTEDYGTTWTAAGGNLPDFPVTAVTIIEDSPNHWFVGTDIGVMETTDGGLSYTATPTGLPNVVVQDLSYNVTTRQLVAATHGRGLWKFSLASSTAVMRGDVNRDGVVNAFDALLTQQALVGMALTAPLTALPHGDSNCNSTLELADAMITLRAAVGLTTTGSCAGTIR
jgi:photosystem II stability/assembly factor-like uncharacterized protein